MKIFPKYSKNWGNIKTFHNVFGAINQEGAGIQDRITALGTDPHAVFNLDCPDLLLELFVVFSNVDELNRPEVVPQDWQVGDPRAAQRRLRRSET